MNLRDLFADRIRRLQAKKEQEYFDAVNFIAKYNIMPTHGPYGSNLGMGVHGYMVEGRLGVVYVKDEDVEKAKNALMEADESGF